MKRIALLLVCGACVASAQEARLNRAVLLKSERTLVSLRSGTMVNVLSRDEQTVTVRFNNHTGTIPVGCLAPSGTSRLAGTSLRSPAHTLADLAKESAENGGPDKPARTEIILASN